MTSSSHGSQSFLHRTSFPEQCNQLPPLISNFPILQQHDVLVFILIEVNLISKSKLPSRGRVVW